MPYIGVGMRPGGSFTMGNALQGVILPDPTSGMTVDASWIVRGDSYLDLANATESTAKVSAIFNNTDVGILMESGATGAGLILYMFEGVLYFRCGRGGGNILEYAEISYAPTSAINEEFEIIWSASTVIGKAALYVNRVLVGTDTFSHTILGGTNPGTIGEVEADVVNNRADWTLDESGVFTGTVSQAQIFNGEITTDVQ